MGGTMFALRSGLAALGIAVCAFVGCNTTKKYDLKVAHEEKFDLPPDQARYNNPPESEYKKPPPKEFFKPGAGGMNPSMGGMGGQQGAQGMGPRR